MDDPNMKNDFSTRDELAFGQTFMALTRTFLAFCRTALGFLASGAGLIILQSYHPLVVVGYICIVLSIAVLLYGTWYCRNAKKKIEKIMEKEKTFTGKTD